jgi:hypothetical protein
MGDQTIANAVSAIENPSADDALDGVGQKGRHQVVIDVLATAIVELLIEERSYIGGKHGASTC